MVDGTKGTYPKEKSAWLPLRWSRISGEDYGRGRVEEYFGDFVSLDMLTKAIVTFAAAAAKVLVFVDPSGHVSVEEVTEAESGEVKEGRATDVSVLQLEKSADFAVANVVKQSLEQRLEKAFLLASSVQRQAERVTAEEIRLMVGELESALGGVYSVLNEEFQRPYVARNMHVMQKKNLLPALPEGVVSPQIITGLEGLGRNADVARLKAFVADIAALGPELVERYVDLSTLFKRLGAGYSLDLEGLLRTKQEVQATMQQAQQQALAEKLGPHAIKAASDQSLAAQSAAQPTA
jgi:hypothetical protein